MVRTEEVRHSEVVCPQEPRYGRRYGQHEWVGPEGREPMTLIAWCSGTKLGNSLVIAADDRVTHVRGNTINTAKQDKLVNHLETWWTTTIGDHAWGLYATELMRAIVSPTADDPFRLAELAGPYLKEAAQTTERFYSTMSSLARSVRLPQENALLIAALDKEGEDPCVVRVGPPQYEPLKLPETGAVGDGRVKAQEVLSDAIARLPTEPALAIQASVRAVIQAIGEAARVAPTVGSNGMVVTLEKGRSTLRRF